MREIDRPAAIPRPAPAGEAFEVRYLSWPRTVWRRFRRHPLALAGAGILGFITLLAVLGPSFAPSPSPVFSSGSFTPTQTSQAAHQNAPPQLWPPSWRYLLGTDQNATPILREVLTGGSAPLAVGILGALLASLIGIVSGAIAGYLGGWPDTLWMRLTDAFLAIPLIPLLLIATTSLVVGGGVTVTEYVVLFGLLGWPQTARLIRGYVLSMREFVQAARAVGLSESAIVFRHIVRNVLGVMIVAFTLNVAVFIGTEVTVEFLGAPSPGAVTWGAVMAQGFNSLLGGEWWSVFFPAACVLFAILGVNLLGDGMRDAIEGSPSGGHGDSMTQAVGKRAARSARWSASLRRLASLVAQRVMTGLRPAVSWLCPAGRMVASVLTRVDGLVGPLDRVLSPDRSFPRRWMVGPVALAFLAGGAAFLLGHAPLTYAPNYRSPIREATIEYESEFASQPLSPAGWSLFYLDPRRRLTYRRIDLAGKLFFSRTLAVTQSTTDLGLARNGRRSLGIWLANEGQTLRGVYPHRIGAGGRHATFTIASGISIEHPFILAAPHGGFDVLWGQADGGTYDLELASIPARAKHVAWIRRLVRAPYHALMPHAAFDGSGNLDLAYLNLCCDAGQCNLVFQRFTQAGQPLGHPVIMTSITSLSSAGQAAPPPARWGIDVERASDGTVWAGGLGDYGIYLGHWSRSGKELLLPQPLSCGGPSCVTPDSGYLALIAQGRGGFAYFLGESGVAGNRVYAMPFDLTGLANGASRVDYDYGGGVYTLHAGPSGGTTAVIWEKLPYTADAILESARHGPRRAPDLAERLGLNIGST